MEERQGGRGEVEKVLLARREKNRLSTMELINVRSMGHTSFCPAVPTDAALNARAQAVAAPAKAWLSSLSRRQPPRYFIHNFSCARRPRLSRTS